VPGANNLSLHHVILKFVNDNRRDKFKYLFFKVINMSKKTILMVVISISGILTEIAGQEYKTIYNNLNRNNIPLVAGDRYLTDDDGNIRMWVNVWGHVNNPGYYLIYDGTDVITLLTIAGGLKSGANTTNIKIYREFPNEYGEHLIKLNLTDFFKNGNRNIFPKILPNDVYFISEKTSSFLLSKLGIINTLMSAVNLYYLALIRSAQLD